jgi:hypothetical protein
MGAAVSIVLTLWIAAVAVTFLVLARTFRERTA